VCMGCRHAVGDKKGQSIGGRQDRKGRLRADGCSERAEVEP
jgi:hypothetical protein